MAIVESVQNVFLLSFRASKIVTTVPSRQAENTTWPEGGTAVPFLQRASEDRISLHTTWATRYEGFVVRGLAFLRAPQLCTCGLVLQGFEHLFVLRLAPVNAGRGGRTSVFRTRNTPRQGWTTFLSEVSSIRGVKTSPKS